MIDNFQNKLAKAFAYFQAGEVVQADRLASEVLIEKPNSADALHLRGVVAGIQNKHFQAEIFLRKASKYQKKNHFIFFNLAKSLSEQGKDQESLKWHRKAIELNPNHEKAWLNYGKSLFKLKVIDSSIIAYDRAIAINPLYAEAFSNRGLALQELSKTDKALGDFSHAIEIDSNLAEAWNNRGNVLTEINRLDEAITNYDQAIHINPLYAEAYNNRGITLKEKKRLAESLASYDSAIEINLTYAEAYSNRGLTLTDMRQMDAAIASFDHAIKINPSYAEAFSNRGNTLVCMKKLDEAIASFDRAIEINPEYAEAKWNKALALLLDGQFSEGWPLYEWRWKYKKFSSPKRDFLAPLWLGNESLTGKTILLHAEQGLGDTIQFCRYAKLVKALGAKVILEVPKILVCLLGSLEGVDELIEHGKLLPFFDFHTPLLSLPLAFKTDINNIPNPTYYLAPTITNLSKWKVKLGEKVLPRVGLVWSGNSTHINDHNRSLLLENLLVLLPNQFEYISLQKEVREIDESVLLNSPIKHFGESINDFADTAALCKLMDIVISVDTSVAHLSGAIGNATYLLLPYSPDWRWLLERTDSPWYQTTRLYRQSTDGEWNHALAELINDLLKLKNT